MTAVATKTSLEDIALSHFKYFVIISSCLCCAVAHVAFILYYCFLLLLLSSSFLELPSNHKATTPTLKGLSNVFYFFQGLLTLDDDLLRTPRHSIPVF